MSIMPRRQYGALITVGVVVVAAVVAGALLLTSSRADVIDLTTAELVPADAGVYIALNTDLASTQWIDAFALIERLGEEDPEGQLRGSVEEQGDIDWEDDIAPFLGGNAAFFLADVDPARGLFQGAVILQTRDAERAERVLIRESGGDFVDDTYRGVEFKADRDEDIYIARIEEHLILAADEESLLAVIDVSQNRDLSLARVAEFQQLRDQLTANFLSFVYVDAGTLFEDSLAGMLGKALAQSGADELALKPMAIVIGATGNAFELQAASVGDAGPAAPALQPRTSRFAAMVPAEAAIFVSTFDLAGVWTASIAEARDELDELIADSGAFANLDEALAAAGQELGLESIEELIAIFDGESALAVWFPSGDEDDAEFVFLAEVSDEQLAQDVLDTIVKMADDVTERQIGGATVYFGNVQAGEFGLALAGDYVAFGSRAGLEAVLLGDRPTLAGFDRYVAAVDELGVGLGTYGFFDVSRLLRLTDGTIPVDLDEAERALEALIVNFVSEAGVTRAGGALTIEATD